jgi:valyl-tRNA synthetase
VFSTVGAALGAVRKAKSEAKVGMRTEVAKIVIAGSEAVIAQVRAGEGDLRAAGRISGDLMYAAGDDLAVSDVELVVAAG